MQDGKQGMEAVPSHARLNLRDEELVRAGSLLTDLLRRFEASLEQRPVVPVIDRHQLSVLLSEPFLDTGCGLDSLFSEIESRLLPNCTTTTHPRFLAYVLGSPNGFAPFAEAIAATINQNCNFWHLSSAASVIERKILTWLAGLFAYPDTAGGILTSGGSMATLMALSAAIHCNSGRDVRRAGLFGFPSPLVIYTSAEAHGCVEKAASILGLGLDNVRKIPVDTDFRMRADMLASAVAEDRRNNKTPLCVVGTAGTVNTGAIDPLDLLADLCVRENLWFHVDGAYGALFALAEATREALMPCGRADSLALDPHKLLFAPLEAGCLLVRDRENLRRAFHFRSSYLTVDDDPLLTNFLEYGPQLSRSFKAFKIWCALRLFGIAAFRAAHRRILELAQYMAARILAEPALELMAPVTLTAVCLRFKNGGDPKSVLEKLTNEGTALLGPVLLNGQPGIRACIANFRTTERDIDKVIDRLLALGSGQ